MTALNFLYLFVISLWQILSSTPFDRHLCYKRVRQYLEAPQRARVRQLNQDILQLSMNNVTWSKSSHSIIGARFSQGSSSLTNSLILLLPDQVPILSHELILS